MRQFDNKFLMFLGNQVGRTLKVDVTTVEQARGKYAHIYVEIDLKKELLSEFAMHGKNFCIQYESLHIICFQCGNYEHLVEGCPK